MRTAKPGAPAAVNDQKLRLQDRGEHFLQRSGGEGLRETNHQLGRGKESGPDSLFASQDSQSGSQVCFSSPDRSIENEVLLFRDERSAGKLRSGEIRRQPQTLKVVARKGLVDREARFPEKAGPSHFFAVGHLADQNAQEKLLAGGRAFLLADMDGRLTEGQSSEERRNIPAKTRSVHSWFSHYWTLGSRNARS